MARDLASLFAQGPRWVLGLMSGTSLDGVDVALIRTDGESVHELGPWRTMAYKSSDREALRIASEDARAWAFSGPEPDSFKAASHIVTHTHAEAIDRLLASPATPEPELIGFHGQTVLHRRPKEKQHGATLQLGDGQALADAINKPVVYDFRQADVAAGGEGAPLAPVYHAALMRWCGLERPCAFLNIGGVANITWCGANGELSAFDTGPGNGPIDEWVSYHGYGSFDRDGAFAARGTAHEESLLRWLELPYFATIAPKSADRGDFPAALALGLSFEDGAASLTHFAARTIITGLETLPQRPGCVILTGGGRHNTTLVRLLRQSIGTQWIEADETGLRGDAIEAEAFAYLAVRSVCEKPLSYPATTGLARPLSGGRLALPAGQDESG